ncbi:MAG: oligosaccharide flippase family protein [Candidatus Omnitrophica bacterium]|nr:oligosaccharide flippase family protein [Candidatus Omnitrophota bacterium]
MNEGLLTNTLKKTGKHSLIYGIGMSFTAISGTVLVPLYTRFLSPSDYGIYALIGMISSLLFFLYDFGMINAIFRWYYQYEPGEAALRRRVISTAFIFLFSLAALFTLALWAGAPLISNIVLSGAGFTWLIRLMLIGVLLQSLTWVPLSILRIKGRAVIFAAITMSGIAIMIAANYFLLSIGKGLEGVYEAFIIAYLFMAVALFFVTRGEYAVDFSMKELKGMLKFGLPYLPVLLFSWGIDFSDRYLLSRLSTLQQVGLYSVGYKIGQAMYLAIKAFTIAWVPLMLSLSQENRDKAQKIFGGVFTYFMLAIAFLFLSVSVFSREIIQIFTSQSYQEASKVIPWIAFAYLLNGIYIFMLCSLIVAKSIYAQPVILLISVVINILLNILWIPKFGMMGSAAATVVSYFLVAAATYITAQKLYPIPVEWKRMAKIALAVTATYVIAMAVPCPTLGLAILLKGALMAVFFYALYLVGFFHPKEIDKLKLMFLKERK